MFAKAPRFNPGQTSETPGPNSYKPPEESRLDAYKKGAFLEKANRFRSEKNSDTPGPGTYNVDPKESHARPGPKPQKLDQGSINLQQQIEALKAQNARLLKEHQQTIRKYEDKVAHSESTVKSLVKDNVTLQSQLSIQQKEHRSISQREAALRAVLEKAEASTKGEADRASKLAGLQRKLQDLEKIHSDNKKHYLAEVEHLKCELDASRKASSEHSGRAALLRKQQDTSESLIKDLKKAIVADQAEIKEFRMKAQNADQAKNQAVSYHNEVEQLKNLLHDMETKHKNELHGRDTKIARQEKALAAESRRGDELEQHAGDARSRACIEANQAMERNRCLQEELDIRTRLLENTQSTAVEDRQQLTNARETLMRVVEAYGELSASSIPLDAYRQSELQCASLRLRNIRLERRLADREALVEQLTDYCRQASDERSFLSGLLCEAENDQQALLDIHSFDDAPYPEDSSLLSSWFDTCHCASQQHEAVLQSDLDYAQAMGCLYQAQFNELLVAYTTAHRENEEQDAVAQGLIRGYSELQREVENVQMNYSAAKAELGTKAVQVAEALTREHVLNERLATAQREATQLKEALRKERETSGRLAQAYHQSKKNEERRRLEVDELIENLADVTRYKEAHADLLSEVIELIQRNELAEAEAERLGKFNAEILGHANPQQKIFYIDRIRRELADTKHQLLKSTRDREDLAADNVALQHEVAAYKSVVVPIEQRPRGTRVRIERAPLAPRTVNASPETITFEVTPPSHEGLIIDNSPMTLDEIM